MKKLFIGFLSVLCLVTLCAGLTACKREQTEADKLAEQGYLLSVRYDASGGKFLNIDNSYFLDMFNPSKYTSDVNGKISVKLYEPTDPVRNIPDNKLTKSGYFYVGWYRNRALVTDGDGNVLDEDGNKLYVDEITGEYFSDEKHEKSALPAYTYSDRFDFDTDKIEYVLGSGKKEVTLYAAWVKNFTFTYYYEKDGEWTQFGTTDFDYKYNSQVTDGDLDTCYLPDWSETITIDGASVKCGYMNHVRKYAADESSLYTFPQLEGSYTFKAAYTDSEKLNAIDGSVKHGGSINLENATAVNPDKKIYVEFDNGAYYRIASAKQFVDNADLAGNYEILCDLNFSAEANGGTAVKWSALFESGTFSGTINGNDHKILNAKAEHLYDNRENGGLFGKIAKGATVKDLAFENAIFDLSKTGAKITEASYGLFAGLIEDDANVSGITLKNSTFKIFGDITVKTSFEFNLVAGGDLKGIAFDGYKIVAYGRNIGKDKDGISHYLYRFEFVKVEEEKIGLVSLDTPNREDENSEKELYSI